MRPMTTSPSVIQCHYDVLSVPLNADAAVIKKAHRKLALQLHPDKNLDNEAAAEQFRLVQQAYECLSDPVERKWYDEHRDAILKGWSTNESNDVDMLFDTIPFMHPSCYSGYGDGQGGFFQVYSMVFHKIYEGEQQARSNDDHLPVDFGAPTTSWDDVAAFYKAWESFTSALNFAWADPYDIKEAPNRRVRRAMEEENKKARRTAKRARNDDVIALVRFVKRRDPRVQERQRLLDEEKAAREMQQKQQAVERKKQAKQAREQWLQESEEAMAALEEEDRLAGRLRLADLEDDYDYGGKKGRKGKKKNRKNAEVESSSSSDDNEDSGQSQAQAVGDGDEQDGQEAKVSDTGNGEGLDGTIGNVSEEEYVSDSVEESSSDEEPDFWRCKCCRKDFKSEGQMENHMKSKKHKESWKKYQARLAKETS